MRKLVLAVAVLFLSALSFAQSYSIVLNFVPGLGGETVSGFIIQRATVSGGPYTTICGGNSQPPCPIFSPTVTHYTYVDTSGTDNVLVGGSTYFYVVVATGPKGKSPHSNEVRAFIPHPGLSATVI